MGQTGELLGTGHVVTWVGTCGPGGRGGGVTDSLSDFTGHGGGTCVQGGGGGGGGY